MKIVNKPIEMISKTNFDGVITPIKFRIIGEDGSLQEVKITKIITRDLNRLAGNRMWIYNCQSIINGLLKRYEIRYEVDSCRWVLFKI